MNSITRHTHIKWAVDEQTGDSASGVRRPASGVRKTIGRSVTRTSAGLVVNGPWVLSMSGCFVSTLHRRIGRFVPGRRLVDGTGDSHRPKVCQPSRRRRSGRSLCWEISRPRRQEAQVRVCRVRLVASESGRGTTPRIAGRIVGRSS